MSDKIVQGKRATVEALEKALGVVSVACRAVGISRDTHYRWLREDEDYKVFCVLDLLFPVSPRLFSSTRNVFDIRCGVR